MHVEKGLFGTYQDQAVEQYTLDNGLGLQVKIMTYGATVTSITLVGSDGSPLEITCGFDEFESYFGAAYQANAPYFGGTVGRYCSQIKGASFSLDGQEYPLFANVGENNLHGGKVGFDKRIWTANSFEEADKVGVSMRLESAHLEEGFPGNVSVEVRFSVDARHQLLIEYEASTDQATPFTITNHTYFNLTGFAEGNEGHEVQIQAGRKLAMDGTGAATGEMIALDGAIDDMRESKTIGEVHQGMGTGFEHYFVFDKEEFGFAPVASIKAPNGGISMEVATSEPGMLFYSGMYTSDELARENGQQFGKYRAFCCETHRYPNGPNLPASPKSILQPGESYQSKTSFTFHLPSAPEA